MINILHFTAEWCSPCKQLTPIINELISENPSLRYKKIDVDQNQELSLKYNVRSIPAIIFESNGTELSRVVGLTTKHNLKNIIDNI
jgi:thioredoxin 1